MRILVCTHPSPLPTPAPIGGAGGDFGHLRGCQQTDWVFGQTRKVCMSECNASLASEVKGHLVTTDHGAQVLTDSFFEHGAPGDQVESQTILEYRKSPAGQADRRFV